MAKFGPNSVRSIWRSLFWLLLEVYDIYFTFSMRLLSFSAEVDTEVPLSLKINNLLFIPLFVAYTVCTCRSASSKLYLDFTIIIGEHKEKLMSSCMLQ